MTSNRMIADINELRFLEDCLFQTLMRLYSDKVGVINALLERTELQQYGLFMFQCLSARARVLFSAQREVSSGGLGIGNSREEAIRSCLGEAIERYCLSFWNPAELVESRAQALPDAFVPAIYSEEQHAKGIPFKNPARHAIRWTRMFHLRKKRLCWYPAGLVYLPFDEPIAETTSTGTSAHTDPDRATCAALLEVVERDAIMEQFLLQKPVKELRHPSLPKRLASFVQAIRRTYDVHILELPSPTNIPVYLSMIIDRRTKRYGIGACAHTQTAIAIRKALIESLFTETYSRNLMHLKPRTTAAIDGLHKHFLYYQGGRYVKLFPRRILADYVHRDERPTLPRLARYLKRCSWDALAKEITTADVRSLGYHVVRVCVPQALDLNKSHRYRKQGNPRLRGRTLNPDPHPFP